MLRYIITMVLLIPALFGRAQEAKEIKGSGYILTEQREVDFFDRIEVSSKISVYIVQGEFQPITIEADNNLFPYIKTIVRNRTLKIYVPDTANIVKFNDMNVLISMPTLTFLQARQASYIEASPQEWKVDDVVLQASSGSRMKLATHAANITISARTSAYIELKGRCDRLEAILKSGARLDAWRMEVEEANLDLATRARAEMKVNKQIAYSLIGNAKLIYHGNPQVTKSEINSGSKVTHDK